MSELGVIGLVLLVVALAVLLGGFAARGGAAPDGVPGRRCCCGIAWALHAGIDWDWEMPAVTWWLFALGGSALAAAPLGAPGSGPQGARSRIATGLGCAVLAITPVLVIQSQTKLDDAVARVRRPSCAPAIDAALGSRGARSVRAEPFEVLGFCDVRLGQTALA